MLATHCLQRATTGLDTQNSLARREAIFWKYGAYSLAPSLSLSLPHVESKRLLVVCIFTTAQI